MKSSTAVNSPKKAKTKRFSQKFPPGLDEAKVRAIIDHYDNLTEEEWAREIEEAPEIEDETTITVPVSLVPVITRLIREHERNGTKASSGRRPASRRRSKKPRNATT